MTGTASVPGCGEHADGQRKPARLPGLDGIRALAILAVLVYHVYPAALPGGYLGVDLFFVLSGYLITRQLVAEKARTGRIRLRAFWVRRARRILPALLPVLLVTTLGVAAVDPAGLRELRGELLGAVTFTSNWLQIAAHHSYFTRFSPPAVLQHLWSLAVEEQFYLLWPLVAVLVLLRGRRQLAVLAAVVAAGSAVLMGALSHPGGDPSRVYFGTDTHCFGLLLGAALAIGWIGRQAPRVVVRRLTSLVGLGTVIVALCLLGEYRSVTYRGGIAVACAATALLIVGGGHGRGPVGRALASRPARWLGARSYGLYLWHWPVLVLGDRITRRTPLSAAVEVGIAVACAALSYRYLERPMLRPGLRRRFTGLRVEVRRATKLGVGALAALVLVAVAAVSLVHAPVPADAGLQAQLAIGRAATRSPAMHRVPVAQHGAPRPSTTPLAAAPVPSPPAGPPPGSQITALGDSVMLAAAHDLTTALPGIDIDAVVSRAMQPAPGILAAKARNGQLRRIVLLGLGTNGPFPRKLLEGIVRQLGPHRQLYLVNVWLPTQQWAHPVNRVLAQVAAAHRNTYLINWCDAIAPHQNLLWQDHIHPRPGTGTHVYVDTVVRALTASRQP